MSILPLRSELKKSFADEVEELQLTVSNLSRELIELNDMKVKHGQKFMEVSEVLLI